MEKGDGYDREEPTGHVGPVLDTEGGYTHLTEVIALNTLKEIISRAKVTVEEEKGPFILPSEVQDKLLMKCERSLLNYGEEEAERAMKTELIRFLDIRDAFKERDDERKVRRSLPSDTKR